MTLPATIISGFLGAGKTTLVNHLLRNPGKERLAVLVNDFGAINIDRDLIKVETQNQIELSNGCVCCSIQEDLAAGLVSVGKLGEKFTRIVLECSGVSHPAGVLRVFESDPVKASFHVDSVVCLIDASNLMELDFQSTELAIDQAAMADIVLLNKTDLVPDDTRRQVRQLLQDAQRRMKLVDVVQAQLPSEILFGMRESDSTRARRPSSKLDHPELFESAAFTWNASVELDAFRRFVEALPSSVLRAKGILGLKPNPTGSPKRAVFQLVGKRSSIEFEPSSHTGSSEIILIARRGELDGNAIRAALNHCPGARELAPIGRRRHRRRSLICE